MNYYHIAICDDEERALPIIHKAIQKEFDHHGIPITIQDFTSGEDLEVAHAREPFSLLFLDIDMPVLDGITLAKKLRRSHSALRIIFISNRDELVFQALSVHPFCFIRKSHFRQELPRIVSDLILDDQLKSTHTITLKVAEEVHAIPIEQISYVESIRKEQYLHMAASTLQVHYTLSHFEELLLPHGFLKPHKSYLVNYQYIRKITNQEILLITGDTVPLSRLKVSEIRQAYLKLML